MDRMPLLIAHRGASADRPENSLAAMEEAWRQRADMVELDVHLTADGVPVILHDPTLDRTTEGSGPVRACSADRLRQYRIIDSAERVPLLAEALYWSRGRLPLLLELKPDLQGRPYPGLTTEVLRLIRMTGTQDSIILQSFDPHYLRELAVTAPYLPAHLLIERDAWPLPLWQGEGWWKGYPQRLRGISGLNTWYKTFHPRQGQRWQRQGLSTFIYTVNQAAHARQLMRWGVNGLITDLPGAMRRWLSADDLQT